MINLLPNYALAVALGTSTYGEYVASFIATVHPQVLCMDHYPHFDDADPDAVSNVTMAGYHRNLYVFRIQSLEAGIPFWNFFNSMPFADYKPPTLAQVTITISSQIKSISCISSCICISVCVCRDNCICVSHLFFPFVLLSPIPWFFLSLFPVRHSSFISPSYIALYPT